MPVGALVPIIIGAGNVIRMAAPKVAQMLIKKGVGKKASQAAVKKLRSPAKRINAKDANKLASQDAGTIRRATKALGKTSPKVKKTKATSLPVPKRKPTPPKQKKTTDRIPGPDETEVFINKDAVIDYKQLPKVKRKAGGDLKPIDPETQPGLAALKKESPETVNKMGYAKKGGKIVTAMTGGQIVSMMYDD